MVGDPLLILIVLLILSAFFSSAEMALFSISRTRVRYRAKQGEKAFILIESMKEDPHRLLATILIGNNIVNIGAASIATKIAVDAFQNFAVGAATGIMTLLILIFGEVIPKTFAARNNVIVSRLSIYPLYWFSVLFLPLLVLLNFVPRIAGRARKTPTATEEELMTFVEVVEQEGEIKEEERRLIHKIFELDDTRASEIMTPRADMFVIDTDEPLDLPEIIKSGFTRIPVIQEDIDHVIGILNIKDLFAKYVSGTMDADIRSVMSKPYFVPENIRLDSLLAQFKKRKHHMAIVVDEHGGVSGLITLEDAIEELVGEIRDETDREEPHIVQRSPGEWSVLGKTDIDEVNETIGMEIPDTHEYDTFSGYILDRIGRIPMEKEEIPIGSLRITVDKKEGNRIIRYTVRQVQQKFGFAGGQRGEHEPEEREHPSEAAGSSKSEGGKQ
ncbi:MAG: HlyC/CorC family transporter [Desulfobacteraceae bacterium]|nr:MAG: HlyC/CorC family transporter [Desulfobacteraceae bacterium]